MDNRETISPKRVLCEFSQLGFGSALNRSDGYCAFLGLDDTGRTGGRVQTHLGYCADALRWSSTRETLFSTHWVSA